VGGRRAGGHDAGAGRGDRVVGLDAAGRHGWLAIVVDDSGFVDARFGTAAELIDWAGPVEAIGIDIPIGHVDAPRRRADVEARAFIGARGSSVFAAPPLQVLDAPTYLEANQTLTVMGRPKLSRQAWNLVPRIVEVAAIAQSDPRVVEVHPEVSFTVMAGRPLEWSKKSWNGLQERRRLLGAAGIVLPDGSESLAGVVTDDVVDAAAAAWSARRVANGTARTFPDPPERSDGRPVAIWC